jgi:Fe(3+) dicitrate transport protein
MAALSAGVQVFKNDLHRQQLGKGTTGSDFDLSIDGAFGRDLHFRSNNIALFAENVFWVTPLWSVTPGVRMEIGSSDMTGTISYYNEEELPTTIDHKFPLFGLNTEYALKSGNIYAGFSQAYRPVLFKDIIPASTYERTDKSLKDAEGYNLELGYRGAVKNLRWDVSGFMLRYNNRPGSVVQESAGNGNYYILRTTIGNSLTSGVEAFAEYRLLEREKFSVQIFTSTALFKSEYINATVRAGTENITISGNEVETVPNVISRNGLNIHIGKFSSTILYSYTGKSFADPLNTVKPSASGSVGVVPSYGILDFNSTLRILPNLQFRFNLNNVLNKSYFTKRPAFYPGPGVWSSDGRSVNVTVSYRI